MKDPIQPEGGGFVLTCPWCKGAETFDKARAPLKAKYDTHLKTCKKKGDTP